MSKRKTQFNTVRVASSKHLESIIEEGIKEKDNTYFLILNEWDKPSEYFWKRLPENGEVDLNVINVFDVPNALTVISSCIKEHKETISTMCLSQYEQLPMLVVLHTAFPRVVTYNGSISAELGL